MGGSESQGGSGAETAVVVLYGVLRGGAVVAATTDGAPAPTQAKKKYKKKISAGSGPERRHWHSSLHKFAQRVYAQDV